MEWHDILLYIVFATVTFNHHIDSKKYKNLIRRGFITPSEVSPSQDLFNFKNEINFILSSNELNWDEAELSCNTLTSRPGTLAVIDTDEKATFLAEALGETFKLFDNVWIAGRLEKGGLWSTHMVNDQIQYLPKPLLNKYIIRRRNVYKIKRECLSFRRSNHLNPKFVDLNCHAQRSYLCQQSRDNTSTSISTTHPGWIQIENRLYKVFYDQVSWFNASINCFKADSHAKLAVITSYRDAQILGRHLLIGRPSLENAWIGATWNENEMTYEFTQENLLLPNDINKMTKYPPWRKSTVMTGGCLLLDRHLAKITLFVETRCQRLRPYICYKFVERGVGGGGLTDDFQFPERDYRLFFAKLRFVEAVASCTKMVNNKARGVLAQPKKLDSVQELLFIMGENRTYVQHIWIGGKYSMQESKWRWLKKNSNSTDPLEMNGVIPETSSNGYPPWIYNISYTDDVENMNTCLNMDRENHQEALFYGTDCFYAQSYVCEYPSGTLGPGSSETPTTASPNTTSQMTTAQTTTAQMTTASPNITTSKKTTASKETTSEETATFQTTDVVLPEMTTTTKATHTTTPKFSSTYQTTDVTV